MAVTRFAYSTFLSCACGPDCPMYKSKKCIRCEACKRDPTSEECGVDGTISIGYIDPATGETILWPNPDGFNFLPDGAVTVYEPKDGIISEAEQYRINAICSGCVHIFYYNGKYWMYDTYKKRWWFAGRWWRNKIIPSYGDGDTIEKLHWIPYVPGLGVPLERRHCDDEISPNEFPGGGYTNPYQLPPITIDDWLNPEPIPGVIQPCCMGTPPGFVGANYPDDCIKTDELPPPRKLVNTNKSFKKQNPDIRLIKVTINNEDVCIPMLCEGNCDGYQFCG